MNKSIGQFILLTAAGAVFLSASFPVYAHPGRTASDGCHYCRTNCAKWGEVQGARHCHNGGSDDYVPVAPIIKVPTPTTKPTLKPLPTRTPTPEPTPTEAPSPTINTVDSTPKAEVLGETKTDGSAVAGWLALLAGLPLIFWRAVNQKWPFQPKK